MLPVYGLDVRHALPMADLARRTLDAVLPGGVRLADVPATERRAEADFHLPLACIRPREVQAVYAKWGNTFPQPWQDALAGWRVPRKTGFLTGSMDLFFRHDGRFHLLDWKSNRLGPRPGSV